MSLFPARDEKEAREKREAVELCGKNRGPHDYIPIEWGVAPTSKRVTRLLCRTCFANVTVLSLLENYPDVSISRNRDSESKR
jgi:hypothetical protein